MLLALIKMSTIQHKEEKIGFLGAIIFHALILLLFFILGIKYIVPIPEQGIVVNFGTSDEGMGQIQPENEVGNVIPQSQKESSEEEVLTQENEETVEIKKPKTPKKKPTEDTKTKEEEKISKELQELMEKWKNTSKDKGSEGEAGTPGDQGKSDGDKNSKSHTGGQGGNGIDFSLAGRTVKGYPKITDNSQEQGKVVVDIVVDQNGNVIKAIAGARGSTTNSTHLLKKAQEAALQTKFSTNPNMPEQKGQMTFVFILN